MTHWIPDYTQNLVQAALEHNADLVIAPYWMVIPSNSSKTGHALETLQTSLGIEPEAPKTEVHKYGFLPQGVYSREDYARRLMQQPASFYYGVLWNKLYRREIIAQNQLGFAPDVHWAEDLIFNMGYLEHAQVFVSIPEAGYHYIQNPKSLCHTQIDLRGIVENKTQIFQLFKEVYTRLGLYEELQPQIYKFLFAFSESGVPSDSLQGALLDAMSRLNDASVQPEPSRKKPRRKPQKHARRKKPRHKEE
ncbi:MAG: glycosyl transferase family 2 [Faecalibacterium prausnitzii]